jgi:hypothetical protein
LASAGAGYRTLVLQFVLTGGSGFSGNLVLSVNSSATSPYTMYNTGSTTASTSTAATAVPLATSLNTTTGNKFTIEFPNWDGGTPTFYISGGIGATGNQSRWGVASTQNAITDIAIASSSSWGSLAVTYTLYGVK